MGDDVLLKSRRVYIPLNLRGLLTVLAVSEPSHTRGPWRHWAHNCILLVSELEGSPVSQTYTALQIHLVRGKNNRTSGDRSP